MSTSTLRRHDAVEALFAGLRREDLVVSTTGMTSREAFGVQDRPGNLYLIGSMGLASSLALGLALLEPTRRVCVLEGDGSALMALGTLALIAAESPANLTHLVLDNETYESTGAQPSISPSASIAAIGRASGYRTTHEVADHAALETVLAECGASAGPHLVVAKTALASGEPPPRVSIAPTDLRDRFRTHVTGGRS